MTSAVSSSASSSADEINQQINDFKSGKTKLTKEYLASTITSEIKSGQKPSSDLTDLYESFDDIDKNKDGISYDEYKTYRNSTKGLLANLGISSSSSPTSLSDSMPTLLDTGLLDSISSGSSSSAASLFSSLGGSNSALSSSGNLSSMLSSISNGTSNATTTSSDSLLSSLTNNSSSSNSSGVGTYTTNLLNQYSSQEHSTSSLVDYLS